MESKKTNIFFEELAARQRKIIAEQPTVTYAQALAQVERLKRQSKVRSESKKGNQK